MAHYRRGRMHEAGCVVRLYGTCSRVVASVILVFDPDAAKEGKNSTAMIGGEIRGNSS